MNFWLLPLWIILRPKAEPQKTSASWASWHFTSCCTSGQGKKKIHFPSPHFGAQHFCVQAFFTRHSEVPPTDQLHARLSSHGSMVILFRHKATLQVVGAGLPSSVPLTACGCHLLCPSKGAASGWAGSGNWLDCKSAQQQPVLQKQIWALAQGKKGTAGSRDYVESGQDTPFQQRQGLLPNYIWWWYSHDPRWNFKAVKLLCLLRCSSA